jgi:probable rRNA maturation factor
MRPSAAIRAAPGTPVDCRQSLSIEVNNESGAQIDSMGLIDVARHVLEAMQIDPLAELSLLLLDPEAMGSLHEQWMDLPGPTDVMAFPQDALDDAPGVGGPHGPTLLGDVVLCPSVAAEQAAAAGHSTDSELYLLCTHGILHLLGYDHGEPLEEKEMFELQASLLKSWTEATGRPAVRAPLPGTGGQTRG